MSKTSGSESDYAKPPRDSLEEIVVGDICLSVSSDRSEYELSICDENIPFFIQPSLFIRLSLPEARVLAHLLTNENKVISEAEIRKISGWKNTRKMASLIQMMEYSLHYEIAELDLDTPSYVLRKNSYHSVGEALIEHSPQKSSEGEPNIKLTTKSKQSRQNKQQYRPRVVEPEVSMFAPEIYTLKPQGNLYNRVAVNAVNLQQSPVKVLLGIDEFQEITELRAEQLEKLIKREEAKGFLSTRGGIARFDLAPLILFLNGQGGLYKPAAERLYGEYVKRTN